MKAPRTIPICLLLAVRLQAPAATTLLDFESDGELAIWHDEGRGALGGDKALRRSDRFVASGKSSLRFSTPEWLPREHGGQQRWPAFEGTPPISDWSPFDRLTLEVVNATSAPQKLGLLISDSATPARSGIQHVETLAPLGHSRWVVPLRPQLSEKGLRSSDIRVMHFFTEDPPVDLEVFVDRVLLLEPGEDLPSLPYSYLRDFAALQRRGIETVREELARSEARATGTATGTATSTGAVSVARWISAEVAGLRRRLADIESRLAEAGPSVLAVPEELAGLAAELAHLENRRALRLAFEKVRPAVQVPERLRDDVVVGFATSMEKVLPRGVDVSLETTARIEVRLARNETESFQTVVLPLERDLKRVEVRAGELRAGDGARMEASCVAAVAVGYVETKAVPPYGTPHVGWWPDPILDFLPAAAIARGDAQSFWVRVRAPREQPRGLYEGKLEVLVDGLPVFSFDLVVRVYGFELPDRSPLPLAITFAPHDHPTAETRDRQAEWRQSEDYPVNAWKRHKERWAAFLADYYITLDSLYEYGGWAPELEILKRLKEEGRLGVFNLGYFDKFAESPAQTEAYLARIRPRYERARELGLLEHAYIYGCDENPAAVFPQVERAAARIKAEFPDVPVLTTTYDHTYGLESVIHSIDGWCPLTPSFDPLKAQKARQLGRQVWWYICCGPHHPHANVFIECPAIEGRLLMGVLTAKYRPDGFLYYQISIWNSRRPIESGPFTDWDPRSWTSYHGDGSWTCVGPRGTPLATIRLENFRDGLEDYAYFRILEATAAKVESSPELRAGRADWLERIRPLLVVPPAVAESLTAFTRDPKELYRYRDALAEAIEASSTNPADPWGPAPEGRPAGSPPIQRP